MTPLSIDDSFRFSCSEQVACFNECCRDLNQFLTPYDILRLKQRLGLPSNLFLEQYTSRHMGPETGLPVISLKPNYSNQLKCPFVAASGCSVYEDRPASCRMYPLVRMASRSRKTGKITEHYFLLKEPHCLGFDQEQGQTIKEWLNDQDLILYNQLNDMFMEIISLKNRLLPGHLSVKSTFLFTMACYELDTFRSHIFAKGMLSNYNIDPDVLGKAKHDDVELLKLGFNWIKDTLFKNGT